MINPSEAHVRLQGNRGQMIIRLPMSFYENIQGLTEAIALGVIILRDNGNTPPTPSTRSFPMSEHEPLRQLTNGTEEKTQLDEVGM